MRILIGHEFSGRVRDAFIARGHDAMSCDLRPTESPGPHYQGDVRDILWDGWDMAIFFPDCTYLCSSGLHWNKRVEGRQQLTYQALEHVSLLMQVPIPKKAIENPKGCISSKLMKATQYIQPYQFGDDASKETGLWLFDLPPLEPTEYVEPRIVDGKKRWSNQTDSGQNKLPPSKDRAKIRATTYPGIANAMAEQWSEDWSFLT